MSEIHCKAPWVSACYLPNNKYAPCCAWAGKLFDSREEMTEEVGKVFLRGEIPQECQGSCPRNQIGWRSQFKDYPTDFKTHQLHYLDFRNNNLCNMKCRSCGPVFSTLWASESRQEKINLHVPVDLTNVDLSQVKKIYFAGGEPLLNSQHYDVLQLLIDQHIDPVLMYSTNFSVMSYRQHSVRDLWPKFREIHVHVSIDAIGQYAEFVRSGTIWKDIENNIEWLRSQPNCFIRISTVISAVNIWFLHSLFAYFDWLELPHAFEPILVNSDALIGLSSIPMIYRPPLIDLLKGSRWSTHVNIIKAIDVLEQNNYNQDKWYKFFMQQLILDQYRDESWFWQLPIRHNIYQDMFSWTN